MPVPQDMVTSLHKALVQVEVVSQAKDLLYDAYNSYVIADRAYGSSELRKHLKEQNNEVVMLSKCNAVNPIEYDNHIYKERHIIECFFSKIKYFRRIFSRFDKSARNFLAFLSFAGVYYGE